MSAIRRNPNEDQRAAASLQPLVRRLVTECPCCGSKKNQQHRAWCPGPKRMKLPPAGKPSEILTIANKVEDCILFLRRNQLIRESEVTSIRNKLSKRMPPNAEMSHAAANVAEGTK